MNTKKQPQRKKEIDLKPLNMNTRQRKKFKQIFREKNEEKAFQLFKEECSGFEMLNKNAAGIDIASEENWIALPEDRAKTNVYRFGATTPELLKIRDILLKNGITTVAMESTGVYWICLYDILEEAGIEVYLVNASQLKSVSGRPKTDQLDCRWIQRLHTYGLLNNSFRPDACYVEIRSLARYRQKLIEDESTHVLRMGKALTEMNVLLGKAVSDITGVTGLRIINAILAGERDPHVLATHRDPRCKHTEAEIAEYLTGLYKEEQLLILKISLSLYQSISQQVLKLDAQLNRLFKALEKITKASSKQKKENSKAKNAHIKKDHNAPDIDVYTYSYELTGVDLSQIPGFSFSVILGAIAEVGTDMSHWQSSGHFRSWLGLSPKPKISGGQKHGQTKLNQSRAALHFRLGAAALSRSNTYLGDFYRRMRARNCGRHAVTATAARLATIYYEMVKHKKEYKGIDPQMYKKIMEERNYKSILRRAKQCGFKLVPENEQARSIVEISESLAQ